MRLLVVVDMQEDFVRGVLTVPGAEEIIPGIKARIETCCDICAGHDLGIPYNYSIKTCKKNFDSVCK